MTRRPPARGFTLVELLVASLIGVVVVAAAVLLLVTQVRAYTSGEDDRGVQETARLALEDITGNLRMAGYGLDPAFAFDFGAMANAPMDRAPGGALVRITGYACAAAVGCRDSATGPDELVFLSRDPYFNHAVTGTPTTSQLQIRGPLNAAIRRGQILQVACTSGTLDWAFVTVGTDAQPTSAATVTLQLANGSGTDFPLQNAWLTRPCFTGGSASALKVDRYRYFIGTYDTAGVAKTWGTAGARPFLMLDQGLSDAAGAPILTPVAADVEDLQVTYLFPAAVAPAAGAVPATVGVALTNAAGAIELAPAAGIPSYQTARAHASRFTNHPSNIRGVRVAVVVRSAEKRSREGSAADNTLPAAGNRAAVTAPATGYRHMLFDASTAPRNLDARTPFIPSLSTTSGADNLNVGGG